MSEANKTVWTALVSVQRDLKAPKSQENKFGGYKYRSAEDILNAVKPLLVEHNATLTLSDSIEEVGGRVYVKSTASFACHSDTLSVDAFAREPENRKGMDESQITGAASSYARKYALNGLFAIDDTKDADATNDHGKGDQAKPQSKLSAKPSTPKSETTPPKSAQPKPKADPRATVAARLEVDPEAKWFEVVAFEKGPHKGRTMGDIAADGDHAALQQVLDYIDPVALEHDLAVKRLKAAVAEAKSAAEQREAAQRPEPNTEGNPPSNEGENPF